MSCAVSAGGSRGCVFRRGQCQGKGVVHDKYARQKQQKGKAPEGIKYGGKEQQTQTQPCGAETRRQPPAQQQKRQKQKKKGIGIEQHTQPPPGTRTPEAPGEKRPELHSSTSPLRQTLGTKKHWAKCCPCNGWPVKETQEPSLRSPADVRREGAGVAARLGIQF